MYHIYIQVVLTLVRYPQSVYITSVHVCVSNWNWQRMRTEY